MYNHKFIMYNSLLKNNTMLIRFLIILYKFEFHDILFIPNSVNVLVCFKGMPNAYLQYAEFFNEKYSHTPITFAEYKVITHHLKLECNLSIFTMLPQSGVFKMNIDEKDYFIRTSLHPNDYQLESLSLRIIRPNVINSIKIPNIYTGGLILIGGRTCSGKTSLMYNILNDIKSKGQTIITLEDPIELDIDGITQTDIKHINFNDGIKSILRQNPDWICIGEIRDKTSAAATIRAAMTGHNVIATIHIKDETSTSLLNRFKEMDCKYLSNVISQFIYCYQSDGKFQYVTNANLMNEMISSQKINLLNERVIEVNDI